MKDAVYDRLSRLLCVKSIITLVLTAVFGALALRGAISGEQFLTVFTVVVSFYFGTQTRREEGK